MVRKKEETAPRFSNEQHGEILLAQVQSVREVLGTTDLDDLAFWETFRDHAASHPVLREYGGDARRWRIRYQAAEFRFSPVGRRQRLEADRVLELAAKHNVFAKNLWDIIGGTPYPASRQISVAEPWAEGALDRIADLFGVPVAYLRGEEPMQLVSDAPKAEAAKEDEVPEVLDLAVPAQDPQACWHAARAGEVLDHLEALAKAGVGIDNEALCAYVDHARVRSSIADITAALLAGAGRK
jgi:hypothetical protein